MTWIEDVLKTTNRDGVMLEFCDVSDINKYPTMDYLFNNGHPFREFVANWQISKKWPIPEAYHPSEWIELRNHGMSSPLSTMFNVEKCVLPPRPIRPRINLHFFNQKQEKNVFILPISNWKFTYETYELTSNKFVQFLLRLPNYCCFLAYIEKCAKVKWMLSKSFGMIKADHKSQKAFLYILPYDFPFVVSQFNFYQKNKAMVPVAFGNGAAMVNNMNMGNIEIFHGWLKSTQNYTKFIPRCYIRAWKETMVELTQNKVPINYPSEVIQHAPTVAYLNKVQRFWRTQKLFVVKESFYPPLAQQQMYDQRINDINLLETDKNEDMSEMKIDLDEKILFSNMDGIPFSEENDFDFISELIENDFQKNWNTKNVVQNNNLLSNTLKIGNMAIDVSFNDVMKNESWIDLNLNNNNINICKNRERKLFKERNKRRKNYLSSISKMQNNSVQYSLYFTFNDCKLIEDKNNMQYFMNEFQSSIFDIKEKKEIKSIKIRNDSFSTYNNFEKIRKITEENLINIYGSGEKWEKDVKNHLQNNVQPLFQFPSLQSSTVRNRISVYGSSNIERWKTRYNLIYNQFEEDKKRSKPINIMGDYTTFPKRNEIYNKYELRNPFFDEYKHTDLVLAFMYQQKDYKSEYLSMHPELCKYRSFLEQEYAMKNSVQSVKTILKLREQMSIHRWTKSESTAIFPIIDDGKHDINHDLYENITSVLYRNTNWLASQSIGGRLQPKGKFMGGNPFQKCMRRSAFPAMRFPRKASVRNTEMVANVEIKEHKKRSYGSFPSSVIPPPPPLKIKVKTDANILEKKPMIKLMVKPIIVKPNVGKIQSPVKNEKIIEKETKLKVIQKTNKRKLDEISTNVELKVVDKQSMVSKSPVIINPPLNKRLKVNIIGSLLQNNRKSRMNTSPISTKSNSRKNRFSRVVVEEKISVSTLVNKIENNSMMMNQTSDIKIPKYKTSPVSTWITSKKIFGDVNGSVGRNGIKKVQNVNFGAIGENVECVISFIDKFRIRMRSQSKFDFDWFYNELSDLHVSHDLNNDFYNILIQEAIAYCHIDVARKIQRMWTSNKSN